MIEVGLLPPGMCDTVRLKMPRPVIGERICASLLEHLLETDKRLSKKEYAHLQDAFCECLEFPIKSICWAKDSVSDELVCIAYLGEAVDPFDIP